MNTIKALTEISNEEPLFAIPKEFFRMSPLSTKVEVLNFLLCQWVNSENFISSAELYRQNKMLEVIGVINFITQMQEVYFDEVNNLKP